MDSSHLKRASLATDDDGTEADEGVCQIRFENFDAQRDKNWDEEAEEQGGTADVDDASDFIADEEKKKEEEIFSKGWNRGSYRRRVLELAKTVLEVERYDAEHWMSRRWVKVTLSGFMEFRTR